MKNHIRGRVTWSLGVCKKVLYSSDDWASHLGLSFLVAEDGICANLLVFGHEHWFTHLTLSDHIFHSSPIRNATCGTFGKAPNDTKVALSLEVGCPYISWIPCLLFPDDYVSMATQCYVILRHLKPSWLLCWKCGGGREWKLWGSRKCGLSSPGIALFAVPKCPLLLAGMIWPRWPTWLCVWRSASAFTHLCPRCTASSTSQSPLWMAALCLQVRWGNRWDGMKVLSMLWYCQRHWTILTLGFVCWVLGPSTSLTERIVFAPNLHFLFCKIWLRV